MIHQCCKFFQSVYWAGNEWPSQLVLTKTDVNAQKTKILQRYMYCPAYLFWMRKGIEFCKAVTGVCWKYGTEYKPFTALTHFYCYPFPGFIVSSVLRKGLLQHLWFSIAWAHELSCCQMLMHFERDDIRCDPPTDSRTGNLWLPMAKKICYLSQTASIDVRY